ncbi:MAG: lipopolysaccharide core heptose(I) kinase RfaP [Planctomyces sp.]|nr:lipopolysaccharide core heptose(I) kinase RfaP [Planctomyces sp.]
MRKLFATESRVSDFSRIGDREVRSFKNRSTRRFEREGQGFYIKSHSAIGWWAILKEWLHFRRPEIGARPEWLALQAADALGIRVPEVVAFGEEGRNDASQRSFLVTREVAPAISLEELFSGGNRQQVTPATRRRLIRGVAEIARRLHCGGLNHRDFYLCHFLLDQSPGEDDPGLTLIDLHRVQQRKRVPRRWLVKDVAGLYFSALDLDLSLRERLLFIACYTRRPLREVLGRDGAFWRVVSRRAHRLYRKVHGRKAGSAGVESAGKETATTGLGTGLGTGSLHTQRHGPLTLSYRRNSPVPLTDERVLGLLETAENPRGADVTVLKSGCRRSVFSLELDGEAVVVKSFPLGRTRKRLRWKRYALAEWTNNFRARERGISTPECYGVFVTRRVGLVVNCGVVMQDLSGWRKLQLRTSDPDELRRAIPVLVELFRAGVNHIDISPENILIDPTTGNHVIIDWQYCSFHEPENDVQLVLQAAHFLKGAGLEVGTNGWIDWVRLLHRASGVNKPLETLWQAIAKVQPLKIRISDRIELEPRNASDAIAILRAA